MRTRLDIIHSNMIQRCTNPKCTFYHRYGGRGISVCKEWRADRNNFKRWALENGYDDTLTLDRINNDGNYEPSNCRWVNQRTQANNSSKCHFVTLNGETHSLRDWGRILGISYNTLKKRVIDHHEEGATLLRPSRRKKVMQKYENHP